MTRKQRDGTTAERERGALRRQRASKIVRTTAESLGFSCCWDHNCVLGHMGGMGTNGGCASLVASPTEMRRQLQALSRVALALAERIADLKGEPTP